MAATVANTLSRFIHRHTAHLIQPITDPSSPPTSPDDQPSPALPGGLIMEHHQDVDVPRPSRIATRITSRVAAENTSIAAVTSLPPSSSALSPDHTSPSAAPSTLSVSSAAVGLIASASRTYHDAQDINFAPRGATSSLQRLQLELKSFKLTAQLLYKWLRRVETGRLPHPDRADLVEVDMLIILLSEAVQAVSEAGFLLVDVVKEAAGAAARISDVVPEYAAAIVDVAERIDRVEHLVSKLLTVIQISSINEAMAARSAIDTILPSLMAENPALAESIRSMPDSFSARSLVPPSRLARLASQPPPTYSVPHPNSTNTNTTSSTEAVPLPDYSAASSAPIHPDGSITIRPLGWSVFSPLTVMDIGILSLVPLPFYSSDVRYGDVYEESFSRRVDPLLAELVERPGKRKADDLARILGLRSLGVVGLADQENFARRVGLEMENQTGGDGELRLRVQPNVIVGGMT